MLTDTENENQCAFVLFALNFVNHLTYLRPPVWGFAGAITILWMTRPTQTSGTTLVHAVDSVLALGTR